MRLDGNGQALRVGIFGGALMPPSGETETLARAVGVAVAKRRFVTVTGATTGLPYAAGKGALDAGGVVLGISPARNADEHVNRYGKPIDGCSHIFYTGHGYTGRNYLNVRNCDLAVFIGGESGTLEEYCIGVYEGLILGALTNSGGVCTLLPEIVKCFHTDHGGAFCFGTEPEVLLEEMIAAYNLPRHRVDRTTGG